MLALNLGWVFWAMALALESTILGIGTTMISVGRSITSMSTLKLTVEQWQKIRADLHTEHPKTVFMIKDKMKRVLGFTVREHQEWITDPKAYTEEPTTFSKLIDFERDGWYKGKRHEYSIRLDFYNERKYTMFLLKYSEYLHG